MHKILITILTALVIAITSAGTAIAGNNIAVESYGTTAGLTLQYKEGANLQFSKAEPGVLESFHFDTLFSLCGGDIYLVPDQYTGGLWEAYQNLTGDDVKEITWVPEGTHNFIPVLHAQVLAMSQKLLDGYAPTIEDIRSAYCLPGQRGLKNIMLELVHVAHMGDRVEIEDKTSAPSDFTDDVPVIHLIVRADYANGNPEDLPEIIRMAIDRHEGGEVFDETTVE